MKQTARFPGTRHLLASALFIAGITFAHAATPLQQALDYQQYLEDQYGVVLSSDPSNGEFANAAQKTRFQEVVFRYAKKDRDNQPGLIHDAWWQPLYTSTTAQQDYVPIRNTVTQQGHYLTQAS